MKKIPTSFFFEAINFTYSFWHRSELHISLLHRLPFRFLQYATRQNCDIVDFNYSHISNNIRISIAIQSTWLGKTN